MGLYALHRVLMRGKTVYATTVFGRSIKWGMELAFFLNRRYFPYDKWLYPFFQNLPELADLMGPLICEGVDLATPWERLLRILDEIWDILNGKMVALGIIPPYPRFQGTEMSEYWLLEHA